MSLKSRLKALVAQAITAPWFGRFLRRVYKDEIGFHGVPVASDSPFVSPVVSAKLFWGIYEGAERRFVQKYLSPDLPVIELGSSIGGISSHVAKRLADGQKLICVEANPHLLPVLEKNLLQNAGHLDARAIHAAISTEPGNVSFAISASSLSSSVGARRDAIDTISAPAKKLGDLLTVNGDESYQLVMDIEGAEAGIVLAEPEALGNCRRIIAELHQTEHVGNPVSVEDLVAAFEAVSFTVRDRHGPVLVFERRENV